MAKFEGFLPSYEKTTYYLGRGMKLSWAVVVVIVVAIVISNYIHEISSLELENNDCDICQGMPSSRVKQGEGHACTVLDDNFVVKQNGSKRTLLEVFCRKGRRPFLHQFYSTGNLDVRCESDDFEVLSGANASEVQREFAKMWGIKLINYPAFLKSRHRLSPFNDTCKGLVHRDVCWVAYSYHPLDVQLVAMFVLGLFLFLSADNLSRNTALFYSSGVGMGVFMSLIIVMLVLTRFMYKRSGFVLVMMFGWSSLVYCLTQLYNNLASIYEAYQTYIVAYTTVTAFGSFAVCYKCGPPSSPRTLDLIRWTVQFVGCLLMFQSSHLPPFYRMSVLVLVLTVYFFPLSVIVRGVRGNSLVYRFFPPKPKLLTEEEYLRQGNEATRKALDELRNYCKSPDCNAWKTISRVKSPQRLAAFVEGDSHLSDTEVLDYESDPQPLFTDDDDLSDDDLHFELHSSSIRS